MTTVSYPKHSPYALTPQSRDFLGRYVHRDIPVSSDDSIITIDQKYHLRPDLLSYDLYGTPTYWWVFFVRNMNIIRDPIWDFVYGTIIAAPSASRLKDILS